MSLHHSAQVQIQRLIFNYNLNLKYPYIEIFFHLLIYGKADPTIKNKDGDTPLDIIDSPIADLFDYLYKYKLQLAKHPFTFNALLSESSDQLSSLMSMEESDHTSFQNIFNTAKDLLMSKSGEAPCTLVDTSAVPNKRKFKLQKSEKSEELPVTKCPVTGQTGLIPLGHTQYIEMMKQDKTPEIKSPKCPFSPNYKGDDKNNDGCSQQ